MRNSCSSFRSHLVALIGAASLLGLAATSAVAQTEPVHRPAAGRQGMAFLGIRILKVAGAGAVNWSAVLPPDCADCRLVINTYAAGQNAREIFFHAWVPRNGRVLKTFRVSIDPSRVRGVLVSYTDTEMAKRGFTTDVARATGAAPIRYDTEKGAISFDLPTRLNGIDNPPDDLGEVSQNYTYIETPGVYIRVGHADPRRRAGPYATGPWPARQAAAALNLEFATREAIEILQLPKALPKLGVATIMLMNFDTNYPTLGPDEAHEDWPPHWHMHLYWKQMPKVRKVAHFYLSESALLTGDFSSDLRGSSLVARLKRWYPNGVANETRTPSGRLVYSQTITPEGYFKLATASGACLVRPVGDGFDSGATVACGGGAKPVTIRATDDPDRGMLMLHRYGRPDTEYRYDTDTGALAGTRKPS